MKIPLLAISDTHLGEKTSLLSFQQGRDRLAEALINAFGEGSEVEELILLGDIPDRTLSSTEEIRRDTRAFMKTLTSVLKIGKVVYVPGNHDHSMWTEFVLGAHPGGGKTSDTTDADGYLFLQKGFAPIDEDGPGKKHLLDIFFDSFAPAPFDFYVANPLYIKRIAGRPQNYLFTHGTHFRADVTASRSLIRALLSTHLDKRLAKLQIEPGEDPGQQHTMRDLEAAITPFVDSLWPSAGDDPCTTADHLWYILSSLSGKFGQSRVIPDGADEELPCYYSRRELAGDRIEDLTPEGMPMHSSLKRLLQHFYRVLPGYLADNRIAQAPLTLIYGDTHVGGWGRLSNPEISVYNTGAWVVTGADHHPPCHIFCIPEHGEEFLLDVSFQFVRHDDSETLLAYAARDVEERKLAAIVAAPALATLAATLATVE